MVEFITVFPVRYHFKKSSYVNRQQKIVELKKSRKSRVKVKKFELTRTRTRNSNSTWLETHLHHDMKRIPTTTTCQHTRYSNMLLNCLLLVTRSPAKARLGRPYGKNGRLHGHIGETGSRNTAATQKINSLTLVSYSLLQTDSFSLGRTVSPQYIRQPDKRSSYLQELVWQPSWQLDTCASVYKL